MEWALEVGLQRRSKAFYCVIRVLIRTLLWRWLRLQARGGENIPVTGPVIVAPVHRSNLDAPLFSGCTTRRLRALGKESLFVHPVSAWVCAALGSIPLRRGEADRDAMRSARAMLNSGAMVLVFPEGTRQSGNQVTGVFDGMSYLASKTGAPIVPVGIAGTEAALPAGAKFPSRVRVAIVVGEPIWAPEGRMSRPALAALSAHVGTRLQEAFDEAQALINRA
ncbi:MAG: 1-acyl-sn-glycerol-3-phosphate acyltransferase [Acidimicrobiia bacterium]|nr:1-acyl-sn-glycerol-3-phosphate acyltransferase [Acidimicrobiia bacterium]